MQPWKALSTVVLAIGLVATPLVTQAQTITVADPAGDTAGPGLDITGVTLLNRDHAVVTKITFSDDHPDDVLVFLKTRDGRLSGVVSRHRRHGQDRVFMLGNSAAHPGCHRLTSDWNRSAATVTLRLPSRCLLLGDYGAVRGEVLIEGRHSGADVDAAPQKPNGDPTYTDWVPRG